MSNTIEDLRKHLFETLEGLKDKEKPLDIERAKAVCDVAGKIIETAKVEVSYLNVVGGRGSGFIPQGLLPGGPRPAPAPAPQLESDRPRSAVK